jgi:peroxiredoxin Q/BCP
MYGREFMGIVRTTFVIDAEGIIRHIFKVRRVAGHAEDVEQAVRALG